MCVFVCLCDVRVGKVAPSSGQCCLSVSAGPSIGSLFHMADDLGRAMESLVSVMTDEQSAEQHEALPFWPRPPSPQPVACFSSQNNWIENSLQRDYMSIFVKDWSTTHQNQKNIITCRFQ